MSVDGAEDKQVLLAFRAVAGTSAGSRAATWTAETEPCGAGWDSYATGWLGIQCDGEGPSHRVVLVNLAMSNVAGKGLLPFLGRLSELRILNLRNNEDLKGDVADLSNLAQLRGLTIRNTAIGGELAALASCSHLGEQGWALFPGDRPRGGGVALGRTLVHGNVAPLRALLGDTWGDHWQDFTPCTAFEPLCIIAGLHVVSAAASVAGVDECACCVGPGAPARDPSTDMCIDPSGDCDCQHGQCHPQGCICDDGYSGAACDTYNPPSSCGTIHQFQSLIAPVNAECCDEPTEDCTSSSPDQASYPKVCNAGCQRLLLPMQETCSAFLAEPGHERLQVAVEQAAANCQQCSTSQDFADLLSSAHAVCCADPNQDCTSGVPAGGCDHDCATALSSLLTVCAGYLATASSVFAAVQSAVASCTGSGH